MRCAKAGFKDEFRIPVEVEIESELEESIDYRFFKFRHEAYQFLRTEFVKKLKEIGYSDVDRWLGAMRIILKDVGSFGSQIDLKLVIYRFAGSEYVCYYKFEIQVKGELNDQDLEELMKAIKKAKRCNGTDFKLKWTRNGMVIVAEEHV